jgi:hypothetical protein
MASRRYPTPRRRQPKPDRRRALELLAGCGPEAAASTSYAPMASKSSSWSSSSAPGSPAPRRRGYTPEVDAAHEADWAAADALLNVRPTTVAGEVLEHLASIESFELARACYLAALELWPRSPIMLRQGARVVLDSCKPRIVKE